MKRECVVKNSSHQLQNLTFEKIEERKVMCGYETRVFSHGMKNDLKDHAGICDLDGRQTNMGLPKSDAITPSQEKQIQHLVHEAAIQSLAPTHKLFKKKIGKFDLKPMNKDKFGSKYLLEEDIVIQPGHCGRNLRFLFIVNVSKDGKPQIVFRNAATYGTCASMEYGVYFAASDQGDFRRSGELDLLFYASGYEGFSPCLFTQNKNGQYQRMGCFGSWGC